MVAAESGDDVWRIFSAAIAKCGFPYCFYIARFPPNSSGSMIHENIEVFGNPPEPIMEQLVAGRFSGESAVAKWVHDNVGNIALHQLAETPETDPIALLLSKYGFSTGQLLSLRDRMLHNRGALLLCPPPGTSVKQHETIWRTHHRDVRGLSWIMHLRMAAMPRRTPCAPLTKRQREVLQWTVSGKTIADVAMILGLTGATVEKHLRLARENLGVGTTAQAILKAHLTHQLFPRDDKTQGW